MSLPKLDSIVGHADLTSLPVSSGCRAPDLALLPVVRAGRRRCFDPEAVRRVLCERASAEQGQAMTEPPRSKGGAA